MNRSLRSECPGCGASLSFAGGDTVLAVCPYCTTTVVRQGGALIDRGKAAELFDDHSPIALQAVGTHDGKRFTVIGRMQFRYGRGIWNDWQLRFDDGSTASLSDDNGVYLLLRLLPGDESALPDAAALQLDEQVVLHGVAARVSNIEAAHLIALEGELSFDVAVDSDWRIVDLRAGDGSVFSLMQLGQPPGALRVLRGRPVSLEALAMSGLREQFVRTLQVRAFACPHCAAPVQARLTTAQTITCPSCASILDLGAGVGAQVNHVLQQRLPNWILKPGSEGLLAGVRWTVLGVQRREGRDDEDRFTWDEYLLWHPQQGFRFLTLDQGHWSLTSITQAPVTVGLDRFGRGIAQCEGRHYDQFATYTSKTLAVQGEFFWQVRRDDACTHTDFIAPPHGLYREQTANEVVWSLASAVSPGELRDGFGLAADALPAPEGIAPLGPVPPSRRRRYWQIAALSAMLMVLAHMALWVMAVNEPLASATLAAPGAQRTHALTIPPGREGNVAIALSSQLSDAALSVRGVLQPVEGTGTRELQEVLSYYSGTDADGEWSEDSRSARMVFASTPAGRYQLQLSSLAGDGTPAPVLYSVVHDTSSRAGCCQLGWRRWRWHCSWGCAV
ncbi:MAG: DUF4178 domain-containing protein [Burkholderiaceae bacterium]